MLALVALILAADAGAPIDAAAARIQLEKQRVALAASDEAVAKKRATARLTLRSYLENSAFPAWAGTPWDFNGTSTTPGQGKIACGYFVTTVLDQAGVKVQRVKLAQQASANIVSTLARGSRVEWLRPADNAAAVAEIRKRFGDGLLVVGFDFHVGFLNLQGDAARFCHSSYIQPATVTCEDPVASGAFASNAYVVADVLNDGLLDDWLAGRALVTQLPKR